MVICILDCLQSGETFFLLQTRLILLACSANFLSSVMCFDLRDTVKTLLAL